VALQKPEALQSAAAAGCSEGLAVALQKPEALQSGSSSQGGDCSLWLAGARQEHCSALVRAAAEAPDRAGLKGRHGPAMPVAGPLGNLQSPEHSDDLVPTAAAGCSEGLAVALQKPEAPQRGRSSQAGQCSLWLAGARQEHCSALVRAAAEAPDRAGLKGRHGPAMPVAGPLGNLQSPEHSDDLVPTAAAGCSEGLAVALQKPEAPQRGRSSQAGHCSLWLAGARQEHCSALECAAAEAPDRAGLKGRHGPAVQRQHWHHKSTVDVAGARNSEVLEQCDALGVAS
jgi:hypothetical protein